MAKVWNRMTAAFTLLALNLLTLQACKFRSMNGTLHSEPGPGDVKFQALDLETRGGIEAAKYFDKVDGAVYIGEITFSKRKEVITNNAAFFANKAVETILEDLKKSLTNADSPQYFAFKGCKKKPYQEIIDASRAILKEDKSEFKDAFVANYSRVWRTDEDLDEDRKRSCLSNLLAKDELQFSFFVKPAESVESGQSQSESRQLLVVSPTGLKQPLEKPAVFESLKPIPRGKVIVILRNDSWGQAKPKVAILPTDRPFTSEEQKDALFAHGWPKEALPLRDNAVADAILGGRPKNLADLSARFAAVSYYVRIGGVASKVAIGSMIPVGFGMAATTAPAVTAALTTALTTHTFALGEFAPAFVFTSGMTAGMKSICDFVNVDARARLDDTNGVWRRREKYCFIVNLIFAVTTAAQAYATTPVVREALKGAFHASVAAATEKIGPAAAATAGLFQEDVTAQVDKLGLGLTNFTAVGYANVRTIYNALENINDLTENALGIHEKMEAFEKMRGLSYGMPFTERARFGCNTVLDLQQLKLGNNPLTRMLNWPGCFKFLRAAYLREQKDKPKIIDDVNLWNGFAASKLTNTDFSNNSNSAGGLNADTNSPESRENQLTTAAAQLKQKLTGKDGPALMLRSDDQNPWRDLGMATNAYAELGRKIWRDIERCEKTLKSVRESKPDLDLCGPNKSKACLYTCARSALHLLRNIYFPIAYLECLETTPADSPSSCTIAHDVASDDGKSLSVAIKSAI